MGEEVHHSLSFMGPDFVLCPSLTFLIRYSKIDWTPTIDHTWVLHFSDSLCNCYNFLTVCRLNVKPV